MAGYSKRGGKVFLEDGMIIFNFSKFNLAKNLGFRFYLKTTNKKGMSTFVCDNGISTAKNGGHRCRVKLYLDKKCMGKFNDEAHNHGPNLTKEIEQVLLELKFHFD